MGTHCCFPDKGKPCSSGAKKRLALRVFAIKLAGDDRPTSRVEKHRSYCFKRKETSYAYAKSKRRIDSEDPMATSRRPLRATFIYNDDTRTMSVTIEEYSTVLGPFK